MRFWFHHPYALGLPLLFLQVVLVIWILGAFVLGFLMIVDVTTAKAKNSPLLGLFFTGLLSAAAIGLAIDFLT